MNLKISRLLLTLLAIINLSNSVYIKDILSDFSKYFYSLNYDKKQDIVNEAVKELQYAFPEGMTTLTLPEVTDLEACKSTLQRAVKQNHEWYLLAMGQYTQLKFYNKFLTEKVGTDLEEALNKSNNANNAESMVIGGVLYNKQEISQLISDAQSLKEENVQLRSALSSLRGDLEKSISTSEELVLEIQSCTEMSKKMESDISKMEKKLSVCRRNEYNLKKIVYDCKRSKFSKFKSALGKPFRSRKLKKALGNEGYKQYKQKKSSDSKKRKELIKNVKKEVKNAKKEKRKKLLSKTISPKDDTPLPIGDESSTESEKSTSLQEKSAAKSRDVSEVSNSPKSSLSSQFSDSNKAEESLASIFESSS